MTRKEANLEICKKLTEFFLKEENKDLRFTQGLFILDINELDYNSLFKPVQVLKDKWAEESVTTLNNLKENKNYEI